MTIINEIGDFIQDEILDPVEEELEDFVEDVGDFLTEGIFSLLGIDDLIDDIEGQMEGTLVTKRGAVEALPVIYGTRAVGGTIVHMTTTGTQNANLWVVYALADADQPISSINKIYMDDVLVWDTGVIQTSKFQNNILIESTVGDHATQPFTTLQSDDPLWTSDDLLLHTAAVAIRYTWDTDVFSGIPKVVFELSGITVRNLSALPTETFSYSNNPAEILFDYLTNPIYGKGLSVSDGVDIDLASFQSAKTYCAELITSYSGGPTHPRFTCDLVIPTSDTVMRNIELILQTCRGTLPYIDGKFHLIIEKHYTAADYGLSSYFNFNEDNVIGSWGFKSGDISSRYNRVKVVFSDKEYNYRNNFVAAESSAFRTEDGRLLEKQVALQGVTDKYRALDTANVVMRKSRQQIKVSFRATTEALQVRAGTIVTVTHPTPGWVDKQFRVINMSLLSDGNVSVSLYEHESTVYDLTVPNEIATAPDTNLPDPTSVPDVTGLAASSLTSDWMIDDWTIVPRIHVTWTALTDPYVIGYDIDYKKSADSVWLPAGSPNNLSADELYIENVDPNTEYDLRIRARNSAGFRSSTWTEISSHLTAVAPTPDAPTGLTASTTVAGEILLSWNLATGQAIRKTQIWASSSDWANAVLLDEKSGTEAIDVTVVGATINYWVIAVNSFGISSIRHPNDTVGVAGTALTAADITDYADYRITNQQTENSVTTISNPQGATLSSNASNQTGAIVVTLPQSWTSTMMKMEINVYDYVQSKSFTALVGGYNYAAASQWINEFAQILGSTIADNRVRFGHDGTKCCIVIGETTSVWQYPKIAVKNFQGGHGSFSVSYWEAGWSVALVTDLTGYTFTGDFSDALLDAKSILGQGALAIENTVSTALIDADAVTEYYSVDGVGASVAFNDPAPSTSYTETFASLVLGALNVGDRIIVESHGSFLYSHVIGYGVYGVYLRVDSSITGQDKQLAFASDGVGRGIEYVGFATEAQDCNGTLIYEVTQAGTFTVDLRFYFKNLNSGLSFQGDLDYTTPTLNCKVIKR